MSAGGEQRDREHVAPTAPTAQYPAKTDAGLTGFRIRPATKSDVPAMVALLSDAFQDDDPVSKWIFPDEEQRRRRQPGMLAALIRHRHLPVDGAEVAVCGTEIVGVSLFRPSWRKPSLVRRMIADIILLRAMGSRVFAGSAVDATMAEGARQGRHMCWVYLACAPSRERSGIGTALTLSVFAKSVDAGVPLFLMMKPGNFEYYVKILECPDIPGYVPGYRVEVGEVTIGGRGPKMRIIEAPPYC